MITLYAHRAVMALHTLFGGAGHAIYEGASIPGAIKLTDRNFILATGDHERALSVTTLKPLALKYGSISAVIFRQLITEPHDRVLSMPRGKLENEIGQFIHRRSVLNGRSSWRCEPKTPCQAMQRRTKVL